MALREPVVVTSHRKPRHVIVAYDHFVALRDRERQALVTSNLSSDLVAGLLDGVNTLRSPSGPSADGDTLID
jgi:PHD/YefM family antitoxin component YafN of YafNO toxin-antitoxin module